MYLRFALIGLCQYRNSHLVVGCLHFTLFRSGTSSGFALLIDSDHWLHTFFSREKKVCKEKRSVAALRCRALIGLFFTNLIRLGQEFFVLYIRFASLLFFSREKKVCKEKRTVAPLRCRALIGRAAEPPLTGGIAPYPPEQKSTNRLSVGYRLPPLKPENSPKYDNNYGLFSP